MASKKIGARTIVVLRPERRDRFDTSPVTAAPEHEIKGCAVLPRTSHEEGKGWVILEGRTIIAPHGSDVEATDQVRVDGQVWEVDGAPGDYEDKKARGKATIFYLKRQGSA